MKKTITPCVENVLIALKECAKAHNANFEDWTDEGQVGIDKECVPVLADVESILKSFYKEEYAEAESGWGYVTAFIYDTYYAESGEIENPFLDKVDENLLMSALPYGLKVEWK